MRVTVLGLALMTSSFGCLAQQWEFGGGAGYGWPLNASLTGLASPGHAGFAPHAAFTVVFDENMYNYIGGEAQYTFRSGGTQLRSDGITETAPGYSNILVYNLMFHVRPRESKFRPFAAVGGGIRIYTNSGSVVPQPLAGFALLTRGTQVEPAVSFDGGMKYTMPRHHVQLRVDLRVYTSPTPGDLIRPFVGSGIKGWTFDLMPMAEIAYVF